eukprot:SAG31_NODE_13645_length_855_cov_2.189153_2_plen_92_part_00
MLTAMQLYVATEEKVTEEPAATLCTTCQSVHIDTDHAVGRAPGQLMRALLRGIARPDGAARSRVLCLPAAYLGTSRARAAPRRAVAVIAVC